MADLEKVIKGLECCSYGRCGGPKDCSYYETDACEVKLMADALALLKGREARVMTLEEIPRHDGAVFFELRKKGRKKGEWAVFSPLGCKSRSKWMYFAFGSNYGHVTGFNIDVYGKFWRCWTSRPTYEQREAVKWG